MSEQQSFTVIPQAHNSPETAYVVNDYPYGGLRCKIRYWLEYKPKHGFRFVSQTTNPKLLGEVWNKPKASTYALLAYLVIDEKGHLDWRAISDYNLNELQPFLDAHRDKLTAAQIDVATKYARCHALYEAFKAAGDEFQIAGRKAAIQYAEEQKGIRKDWHLLTLQASGEGK